MSILLIKKGITGEREKGMTEISVTNTSPIRTTTTSISEQGTLAPRQQRHATHAEQEVTLSKEKVETIVNSMNEFLKAFPNTFLKFEYHEKLNEYYVTIVDEQTQEVIREIPPKKMLDIFATMTEFIGLLVDKKV